MRLYLIRHGKAQRHSQSGRDQGRALVDRGRAQAAWLGAELRDDASPPQSILTSPATRALETANLIAEGLGLIAEIEDRLGLATTPSAVVELLGALSPASSVALVGHNPTLSIVADVLCNGPPGVGGIELRTGQAAVIDIPDPANAIGACRLLDLLRFEE